MSITSIAITGTNAGDFARTTTCGATLGRAQLQYPVSPSSDGDRCSHRDFSVTDSAPGTPHTIPLTGTGTAVTVSPTTLTYHQSDRGYNSTAQDG